MLQGVQLINNGSDETIILKTLCESKEHQAYILNQLDESIFNLDAAKEIYHRALTYLENGKPIPAIAIWKTDQSLSEAARAIFGNMSGCLYQKDDIDELLEKLKTARNKKLVLDTLLNILNGFEKNKDMVSILTTLENLIQRCRTVQATDEFKHYESKSKKKLLEDADQQMSENIAQYAIPSGFNVFDMKTGGLFRKNVLVLASVPGGGKSTMALQMAVYQYTRGYNVCIVTYEMDIPELDNRLYANVSKVNHSEINLKRLDTKKKKLVLDRYGDFLQSSNKNNRLSIWAPQRELTVPQIAMELKPYNYDVVYIDYLSLLAGNPKKQTWENLGEHTRAAKIAANQLNCVLVVLAQLDDETNKIKYSKAIQAHANFIWTWEFGDKERESGVVEINQKKARNAPLYSFYLETDLTIFSFKDYLGPVPDNASQNDTIKRRKKTEEKEGEEPTAPLTDKRGIPKMPILL